MPAAEFIFALFVAMLIMIFGLVIVAGLTMPIHGAIVRLRANYNPKGVGLDSGSGSSGGPLAASAGAVEEQRVGPTLTTLLGTLSRTKRIEGWRGLYKGVIPVIISTILISIASIIFVGSSATKGPKGAYSVPEAGGVRMAVFSIVLMLITLPMTVITNRCIITPYLLPYNAKLSLRLILTPDEFAKPWTLYLAPGLLVSVCLHALWVIFISGTVKYLLIGSMRGDEIPVFPMILFLIFQLLSAFLLTPLEVIATRLSIQRNSYSPYSRASQSESTVLPDGVVFAGEAEDVIGLRPEEEPYEGFVDCLNKIREEEGPKALWRAWWVTALGNLGSAFS